MRLGTWVLGCVVLIFSISPAFAFDDDSKAGSDKPEPKKVEAPSPLTERERWLLDRVEQLEKRVEGLEAKTGSKPSTDTAETKPSSLSGQANAAERAVPNAEVSTTATEN